MSEESQMLDGINTAIEQKVCGELMELRGTVCKELRSMGEALQRELQRIAVALESFSRLAPKALIELLAGERKAGEDAAMRVVAGGPHRVWLRIEDAWLCLRGYDTVEDAQRSVRSHRRIGTPARRTFLSSPEDNDLRANPKQSHSQADLALQSE